MEIWARSPFHHFFDNGMASSNMSDMVQDSNKQNQVLAEIILSSFQNIRTVHLVLSSFGIAAALLVILSIFNDARKAAKFEVILRPRYDGSN